MAIEYRNIAGEELTEWRLAVRRSFNQPLHPDDITRLRENRAEIDRLFGAYEDGQLVGTGGTDSHLVTVPGGAQLPAAGIAYITTAASHRRRGILTNMMRALLEQATEREESIAVLWPSESGIYGRFGYGPATLSEHWQVHSMRTAFAHAPESPGKLRFVDHDKALKLMPVVWNEASTQRAAFMDRTERRWSYFIFDEERVRGGWSGMFHVVYEHNGQLEGYAAYRLKNIDPDDDPMRMDVIESVAITDAAHAAIWRFLFDVDLVETVTAGNRPVDDPVWWMLADPRQLKRSTQDGLWLRLIDPAIAMSSRTYGAEGKIVIEVADTFMPDAAGVYELDGSPGGATCKRSNGKPDISLTASELGAAYLGGSHVLSAERAGRIEEHTNGAMALFDRLFRADRAPWCAHEF